MERNDPFIRFSLVVVCFEPKTSCDNRSCVRPRKVVMIEDVFDQTIAITTESDSPHTR